MELSALAKKLYRTFLYQENFVCRVCGNEIFDGAFVCGECHAKLPFNDGVICEKCGRRTPLPGVCIECKASMPKTERSRSALSYDDNVKRLVLAFKNGKRRYADYFADWLCTVYDRELKEEKIDVLTFVPMTKRSERTRGYNQGRLLAEKLGRKLSLPVETLLKKKEDTLEQKSLGAADRRRNLKDSFVALDAAKGKSVLLIDDVLTTGATSDEVTLALKKKGAQRVYLLTVASVEYQKK